QPQQDQPQQQAQEAASQPSNSPTSPPLPARHTATTPGPRAQRFQESFDAALARTLAKISIDNFGSCYPTIAAQAPHILRQVQRSMVDRLSQLCAAEFAKIQERYAVVPRLNELESLVSDAELRRRSSVSEAQGQNKPLPPHLLPAKTVLAAHLAPHLASQQSQMNARLQNTQAANSVLWDEIRAQRNEVEQLLSSLEASLADIHAA
ncbi:Nnf1-domain-containing protein, partial [Coniella lustricola]